MVMRHYVARLGNLFACLLVALTASVSVADNASSGSNTGGTAPAQPKYLLTLSEAFLRSMLLPDNENGQSDSFITYLQNMLLDRHPSDLDYNSYDLHNLSQMFDQTMFALSFEVGDVRDEIFQAYVDPGFPEGSNFIYEINRALMQSSQTLLGTYSSSLPSDPTTASDTQDQPIFIPYRAPTSSESLDYVLQSTPTNSYSRTNQAILQKYNLKSKAQNTSYDAIANVLNQVDYALFSSLDCASTFLANMCIPCALQTDKPHNAAVMYKDIQNSSCTMRHEYRHEAWNGMGAFINSMLVADKALKSSTFQQAVPDSILQSSNYLATQRGISCLTSDLSALYDSSGNWYNFFHWSTFTTNPDCKALMESAGRSANESTNNGIVDLVISYFFTSSNTVDESKVTTDGMQVVNIISGYVAKASTNTRLQKDPTEPLMRALTDILYRMRIILQGQVSRAAVDVNSDLVNSQNFSQTSLIPDEVYLLGFYMKNYASSSFQTGSACRYQGLSSTLANSPTSAGRSFFDLQKSVMLDMVGERALTPPLVPPEIPFPPLQALTLNRTTIPTTDQIQFLKFGKYTLGGRYRKATSNEMYEGVLTDPSDGYDSVPFSVVKLTAQIQANQEEAKTQIDEQVKNYNRNMNNLILKRMMLAYIYEYISISRMASWRDLQDASTNICPLSSSEQLKISSTWRTDISNDSLQKLITQPSTMSQNAQNSSQSPSVDLAIQYSQSLSLWDNLQTLRDEAFQLAKANYIQFLEYKLREAMLVFKTALLLDSMQNSQAVQYAYPSMFKTNDKNRISYALANTLSSPSSGGSAMNSDGSINSDAVMDGAGVPSSTTSDMVSETAAKNMNQI